MVGSVGKWLIGRGFGWVNKSANNCWNGVDTEWGGVAQRGALWGIVDSKEDPQFHGEGTYKDGVCRHVSALG